ncbi:NADP-dependent 3-hydroxy acid dehydrogenase YdfG [Dokdonia sp. Hel_I_63]|jgi:NADP-dependent 3-hydroxy acid dehydrogenase YdfG|uniref:SDR family oxidoreductase n=1 Tax=unclassified Dokdonia TaxID=2615033 RepID=UPI00020A64E9|nr:MULTISPECIES: SDR family oxidoreductase [unclassified Dokdonia]AEE20605.1 short-chain dehydrogenase/reductase SDR [Dokdonia sp. 4H-3-7-5]TVZ23138.1 NADP-dependent 3-hydroxy acid dehydrogenase YdfG [Dokdonia sp. Hel_I_63]|tara:strand:- start:136360 stop:137100 length:741 start_codon:yes stop_codon:yes gene_type:complete
MELTNKTIIITGASSGIGEATAHKLASHGANVVLMARSEDKLQELQKAITDNGGKAIVATGDVTSKEDFDKGVAAAVKEYGKVDGLINNAGLMPLSFVEKLKTDEWMQMVDVNIKGVLNGVAAVLPELKKNKGGHIINISSMAAHRYFPGGAVYCATKSAVKMFSEGLRQELAPEYGINVTSIEPGAVSTSLTETITDEDVKEMMEGMQEMTTLEAEDIASAIYYSLSQPARVNINDVYIVPSEQK